MIAAFISASCTLSLAVADRSVKVFWRGLNHAPHNRGKTVHTKTRKEEVTQSIIRGRSVLLKRKHSAHCLRCNMYVLGAIDNGDDEGGETEPDVEPHHPARRLPAIALPAAPPIILRKHTLL